MEKKDDVQLIRKILSDKSQLHRARKRLQADQELLISGLEAYYPQWKLTAEIFPEEEAK